MTSTPPDYSAQRPAQSPQPGAGASPVYGAPQPGYAQVKPMPTNTKVSDTNTFALVSVIVTFLVPVAGIIFGHMALSQIKRTGDAGRGLALTGVIYGYSVFVLGALFLITYIGFIFMMINMAMSASDYYY